MNNKCKIYVNILSAWMLNAMWNVSPPVYYFVTLRPWLDTSSPRVTRMNASNSSPTFQKGSSPTWIMTSRCRRRGFVHRRLFLCRRGTNLVRNTQRFLVCISLIDLTLSQMIWDDVTGFAPITLCSPGIRPSRLLPRQPLLGGLLSLSIDSPFP